MKAKLSVEISLERYPKLIRAINPVWPLEKLQRLVDEWNDGASSTVIAPRFKKSRSAIIGKIRRLKALGVPIAVHEAKPPVPKNPTSTFERQAPGSQKRKTAKPRVSPAQLAAAKKKAEQVIARSTAKAAPEDGVTLEELQPHHCRWPKGDPLTKEFRFCGKQKVPSMSYCPTCAKRSYQNLTEIDVAAMTLLTDALEAARLSGQPAPFKDTSTALRNFRVSLGAETA